MPAKRGSVVNSSREMKTPVRKCFLCLIATDNCIISTVAGIRKLMKYIGLDVARLIRVSYGPFQLGSLKEGELNIDNIVAQLGISRTKLFYKIKSLTGQTPNDFFNTYRLNYAAKLLRMNKYKVSAIAEAVGFNSSSHFTTLFKKQFGVLPRQYMDEPGPNQECE